MERENGELLERMWCDVWRNRRESQPIIEVVAEYRSWIERGLREQWFRPTEAMFRRLAGRMRHEQHLDEEELSVTFEVQGRRHRAEVLDVFVRCPALGEGRYGLRTRIDDEPRRDGRRRDVGQTIHDGITRQATTEEVARELRLMLAASGLEETGAAIEAVVDIAATTIVRQNDQVDAMVYATTHMGQMRPVESGRSQPTPARPFLHVSVDHARPVERPPNPKAKSKKWDIAWHALSGKTKKCVRCAGDVDSDYTIAGTPGYCRACYAKSLPQCEDCNDGPRQYGIKKDGAIAGVGPNVMVCPKCYELRTSRYAALGKLIGICRGVADAVAMHWAAALSTHSPAILKTKDHPPYDATSAIRRLCLEHGYGLAYQVAVATPTGGIITLHCPHCYERRALLERSVGFLTSTMLLAAHALWEHQVDDSTKRFMQLERYGDELEPYVGRGISGILDDAPATIDGERGVRELLLEMD